MILKQLGWEQEFVFPAQIIAALIVLGIPIVVFHSNTMSLQSEIQREELRSLRAEKTKAMQSLNILRDHIDLITSADGANRSLDSFALSIIESMEQQAIEDDWQLTHLSVSPTQILNRNSDMTILTVEFEVILMHSMHLLTIFDVIKPIADWRPMEIRSCSVIRTIADALNLQARCAVDIHYYPELDL